MNKKCVIVSGGSINDSFAMQMIENIKPDCVIGVDSGLNFLYRNQVVPTHIVGDFDSVDSSVIEYYKSETDIPIREFNPVKDATDTEIAVRLAMELGADQIYILGASQGNRLDHLFGNVLTMMIPAQEGISCFMVDEHNRMRILTKPLKLKREEQYGKYISLVPLTTDVHGVTLSGFRYPLWDYRFNIETTGSLGISNELVEEIGKIDFRSGILLMLECTD